MTKLENLNKKADELAEQLKAIRYAIYLTDKQHKNCVDMVENVPNNIYHEQWKAEEQKTAKHLKVLYDIESQLSNQFDGLWAKIYELENK